MKEKLKPGPITEDMLKVLKKRAKTAPAISVEEKRKMHKRLTKADAVMVIRVDIEVMLNEKNYTYRDVARWMTDNGCPITAKQVSDSLKKGGGDGLRAKGVERASKS